MDTEGKGGVGRFLVRYVLPVVILGAAVLGARALVASKPEAARQDPGEQAVTVSTLVPVLTNHVVQVQAMGNVVPARRVELRAQVGGRVVQRHPALEVGGRVLAGEVLVEIEREDYEAALAEAHAALAQAQLNEALESQRQAVATDEWRQSGQENADPAGMAIALREPYVEAARRTAAAAAAAAERAARNLDRTQIKAPFDAVVLNAQVETGSVLAPQLVIALLAATDTFHVEAALPVSSLDWIGPAPGGVFKTPASVKVMIMSDVRDTVLCEGRVVRLLGDMSSAGLMARVLVAVDRPYEQTDGKLLLGSYVQCMIAGRMLENVFSIPRAVVRDDETLWIAGQDDRLEIIKPPLLWKGHEQVLLAEGIDANTRIVSSALPAAVPGMSLKVIDEEEQAR